MKRGAIKRANVVCFVNHTAQMGGAEHALLRLLRHLDRERWHPLVVLGEHGPLETHLDERSIENYVLPLGPGIAGVRREALGNSWMRQPARVFGAARYALKLAHLLRVRAVDLVHTNSMKAHVLGGLAARLARVPLVWHLRDAFHPAHLPEQAIRGMRKLARVLPQRIVVVSASVGRDVTQSLDARSTEPEGGADLVHVVYDGLEDEAFEAPADGVPKEGAPQWVVGMIGRMAPWKGQHVFLEAAAKLLERGHNIRFEVAGAPLFGEDAYVESLRRFAQAAALEKHVTFLGQVHDPARRIREWNICVHASTAPDPCPNVVLEAMAAGVPIVASNGGGVPELLEDGRFGALFTMDDSNALCESIESLLEDPVRTRAVAESARRHSLERFRAPRVCREVEQVWDSVLDPQTFERRLWPWLEDAPRVRTRQNREPQPRFAEPALSFKEANSRGGQ